jgi:hypothetical protein
MGPDEDLIGRSVCRLGLRAHAGGEERKVPSVCLAGQEPRLAEGRPNAPPELAVARHPLRILSGDDPFKALAGLDPHAANDELIRHGPLRPFLRDHR